MVNPPDGPSELFEYTTGRWICNDALRRSERRRVFNVSELKRLAAISVNQKEEEVTRFEKLAEGGFNRAFLVTMRNGFQLVARIPYPVTEPKHLVVASEVATMDLLRLHGMPVPKIYGYSATSENAAGNEYVFMELVQGKNLGDIWFDRITIVTNLVELESRLFVLRFPASGSLYYSEDLKPESNRVEVLTTNSTNMGRFCIGPDTTLGLWYGRRLNLQVDRGPCTHSLLPSVAFKFLNLRLAAPTNFPKDRDPAVALTAGAKKEVAYLMKFGRPLHPFQQHINNLEKYLRIAPGLIPKDNEAHAHPIIRHPDLQPNNVFVSKDLEITGLIDWQHCAVLPLFLQCGIPNSFQNYGDSVSKSLQTPKLPPKFDSLDERGQFEQIELLRRRQLHYFYVTTTATLNPIHYGALTCNLSALRRKLFHHASNPWEGDNVGGGDAVLPCPIAYSKDEMNSCLRLSSAQVEADEQLRACLDIIGVGPEGWVPLDQYDEAKQREEKLKADALDAAESPEERSEVCENWSFDDFDEEEYM